MTGLRIANYALLIKKKIYIVGQDRTGVKNKKTHF